MADTSDNPERHGQQGALTALNEVAQNPVMQREYSLAVESFGPEDYEQLIVLAWRYQFDDDRSKFKRELRDLQLHVSEQILARLELNG